MWMVRIIIKDKRKRMKKQRRKKKMKTLQAFGS